MQPFKISWMGAILTIALSVHAEAQVTRIVDPEPYVHPAAPVSGQFDYQQLSLFRDVAKPSNGRVFVQFSLLNVDPKQGQLECPNTPSFDFLNSIPSGSPYVDAALDRGYAVARVKVGYGGRGPICVDCTTPGLSCYPNGPCSAVDGNAVFVPSDIDLASYADFQRPVSEKDVLMAVQHIKRQIQSGIPGWQGLCEERLVLFGNSISAIVSSWVALGPERNVDFPDCGVGFCNPSTRVWGFIGRRGAHFLPAENQLSPGGHWPYSVGSPPQCTLPFALPAPRLRKVSFSVQASASSTLFRHDQSAADPTWFFYYSAFPNQEAVPPGGYPGFPAGFPNQIPGNFPINKELTHSAWQGLAFKSLYPETTKVVLDPTIVSASMGGWYDETSLPNGGEAASECEATIAFDWFDEIDDQGAPLATNWGRGREGACGGTSLLPHLALCRDVMACGGGCPTFGNNGGRMNLRLTNAPPNSICEVYASGFANPGAAPDVNSMTLQSLPTLTTDASGALTLSVSASLEQDYQLRFCAVDTWSNVLRVRVGPGPDPCR